MGAYGWRNVLFATVAAGALGLARAATETVVIVAPDDLAEMWRREYAEQVPAITGGAYEVVPTGDIYRAYPYAADHTDGRPRNPAESIHAFIAARADTVDAFILGGPWVDVDDLATNRVMRLATGETLTLANTVPGVKVSPDARYRSPTDMYYACPDAANRYAWDANDDGVYLDAASFTNSDLTASVAVSRLPLVTWSGWRHADGSLYTQRELLAAYVAKLRRGLAADFEGLNRYGLYGYLINESGVQRLGGLNEAWVERRETAFYDNGYNMFDPARGTDEFWLVEGVSRRRIRDQIATARPVDDVNGFLETTFSRQHADRAAARSAWTNENYALRFYSAHGTRGGGHGFGMDDYTHEGCGLTLFDDCAGPCSTGKIEFDADGVYQMNYAIACVMSPFGGSLATVNNSDYGIADLNNYWKTFAPADSWRYANSYLVGFALSNLTVGAAWQFAVADLVADEKYSRSGIYVWMLAEEMLYGDPLVKLPAVEEGLPYAEGIVYKGLPGQTDTVVSLSAAESAASLVAPETPLRAMDGLTVAGSSFTLCTGAGGIGGRGVVFTGATKGQLTLAGDAPFYVAGVTNVEKVSISGVGAVLDFDAVELDTGLVGNLSMSAGSDYTVRSAIRGGLGGKLTGRELYLARNGTVRLATWDAFGDGTGTITTFANTKIVIAANPWYHDGRDRGESLNASLNLGYKATCDVVVEKGGYFTPVSALVGNTAVTYTVEACDGLGGTVVVPDKARLTLQELPLTKIATLTVARGATLVLPEGTTLDDLLSAGTATLAAGAHVTCGATTVTLDEETVVDGSVYVTKAYYTATATDWTAETKVALSPAGPADQAVTARTLVRFAQDRGPVYIHDSVACTAIEVMAGARLQIGYWDNRRTVPAGWTVDVADGARLTVARWSNATAGPVTIGDDVTLNGAGTVDFAPTVTGVTCGSLSGTATVNVSVPLVTTGAIANVLTGSGSVTTADPGATFRVDADWTGTFAVQAEGQAYEAVYGEAVDGVRTVTFAPVQAVDPTAFGRSWTWFYTGTDGTLENVANWSTVSAGRYVPAAKVPLLTGSNAWEPALLDGARMDVPVSTEGYREIRAAKLEGWELRIGLTNGVSLTVDELVKLQIGAAQYICVDETSRLLVRKISNGKSLTVPFEIAAEDGVVFESTGGVSGYTFVYSLTGRGSIRFTQSCGLAKHRIAAADIELGSGAARAVRSKRVMALDPAKGNVPDVAFAADAAIRSDDPTLVACLTDGPVTVDDAVGTCALRVAPDGVYLDWVARSAAADWPETIPSDATAATLGVTDAAWADELPEKVRRLAFWAKAQGVTLAAVNAGVLAFDAEGHALNVLAEAYLLDCAVAQVADRKALFRFDAFVPGQEPTIDGSVFNGTVRVLGAERLGAPWGEKVSGAHFYKAVLVK